MYFPGLVLGIETSCDETSASLLQGSEVCSNVIASQVEMHQKWGGIVPEAAARAHVEAILPVVSEALNNTVPDAIAVTNRPGLVGALSVGVTAAKALALSWKVPLIGVHHLEGHVMSVLANTQPNEVIQVPHLAFVVSGGHTETVLVRDFGEYTLFGQTIDDAAGEAFDKGARLLGLGYPGGKAVQEAAMQGDPRRYALPRGLAKDPVNFSFSGLKTAMLRLVETEGDKLDIADAAASLQQAIVDSLVKKAMYALEATGVQAMSLVGGVAANVLLRTSLAQVCERSDVDFHCPAFEFCTDNAAMIALAGSIRLAKGERSKFDMDCQPNSPLPGMIE